MTPAPTPPTVWFPTNSPTSDSSSSTTTIITAAVIGGAAGFFVVAIGLLRLRTQFQAWRSVYPNEPWRAFFSCTTEGADHRARLQAEKWTSAAQQAMYASMNWIFISYCKSSSAAEASHFYDETARNFPGTRVFFDAEMLSNVWQIVPQVQNSRYVAVFLTREYIRRPFCLVELCAAFTSKIELRPIISSSSPFPFEEVRLGVRDLAWVRNLLDDAGWGLLAGPGFTPEIVQAAVGTIVDVIAMPLTTTAAQRVRQAEFINIWTSMGAPTPQQGPRQILQSPLNGLLKPKVDQRFMMMAAMG